MRNPHDLLTSWFWSGDAWRSRSVGNTVLSAVLDIPAPPASLQADWLRETSSNMVLEPGDVEVMPFARTRARWPEYNACTHAVAGWLAARELPSTLDECDVALMACRGARYHHDAGQYGSAAFCNLFLSEDRGLDVHFPGLNTRIPLARGTVMIFDTAQPHGVIRRGSSGFEANEFVSLQDCLQVFLTWELPIEDLQIGKALGVAFDTSAPPSPPLEDAQVWLNGAPAAVYPNSGRWYQVDVDQAD